MSKNLSILYEEAGRALHKAQLVEYNLVSIMILFSKIEISKPTEADPNYWSKKTLGQILKESIKSTPIPEDTKLFLETLYEARNHLAHKLFMDTDIANEVEIDRAIREVRYMQEVFDRGHTLMEEILKNVAKNEFSIDTDEIKREAAAKISN
jgi:hypothetical protein